MRHAVLALLILLEGAAFAPAQNHEWAEKLFAQGGTSHDFGNVPRGAVLSYRFPITNLYAVPLRITDVRISCSCVTATPSVQALQPKETGYINVTMDGRRFTGPKTVTIYVTVGPQYISTATLQVSANCRADIVFNPGQVVFGVVPSGQARTLPIDIEYAGALEWKITGIAEHTTPLETRLEQVYRRAPGQSAAFEVGYRLHVTLKPNAPAGTGRWELLLQTNDPGSPTVPVLVEGTIQAQLTAAPNPVRLGSVKVGQEVTQKLWVNGNGEQLFHVAAVEGAVDGLSVDLPPEAGKLHYLTLRWKPTQPGDFRKELHIKTDLNGGATATITVEGTAIP